MKTTPDRMGKAFCGIGWMIALSTLALSSAEEEEPREPNFRRAQSSYALIGKQVINPQGELLGRIKDLAVDLENGRIVEAIVTSNSGFLGLVVRTVAVPPGALHFDTVNDVARLDMDKERFKAAPKITMSNWAQHTESRHVAANYRYFGQAPYFAADGEGSPSGNTATEPLGFVQRSSKLIGLAVKNRQQERLGQVDALIFELEKGFLSHVIVLGAGFSTDKSVIQARALRFNAARNSLILDVSAQAFKDEPRFKWSGANKGDFNQEKYANTAVADNEGVNTKQNVQEGKASTYTPLAQGTSFRDVDKTHRIYADMRADPSLSEHAQNVEVGTLNGQTTLRGHVNTEAGKQTIGRIAARAGRPENVSNLLEVKPHPATKN